jgi:hypothetical protein
MPVHRASQDAAGSSARRGEIASTGLSRARAERAMTYRMISIVAAAAAFALLFSALVKQSERTIRPENGRLACQDGGSGCAPPVLR